MDWWKQIKMGLWLRIGVSSCLLAALLYATDFEQVAAVARRSDFGFLALAFLMAMADRVAMAYKWNVLLHVKHIRAPLHDVAGTYLISTFLGLFLPATVGGDMIRAMAFARRGHQADDVLSSILVERIWGAAALVVMTIGSIGLAYTFLDASVLKTARWAVEALGVFCAALAVPLLLMVSPMLSRFVLSVLDWLGAYPSIRTLVGKCRDVYLSYQAYNASVMTLGWFFLLSIIENVFPVLLCYFVARALHVPVPLMYFLILIPVILLLGRLPISFDGVGIHEGLFVAFFTLVGISSADALLVGLVSHAIGIIVVLPGGVLYALGGANYLNPVKAERGPASVPMMK